MLSFFLPGTDIERPAKPLLGGDVVDVRLIVNQTIAPALSARIELSFAVTRNLFVAAKHAIDTEALCRETGESAHPRTRRSGLSRCAQYSRLAESESEVRRA